ncbi:MAG: SDR family oxidoreductase [Chitinophagaceae bacterium]|nr:MAG: SDR family oxidoreductase [Chitinophagaceae bacterium]
MSGKIWFITGASKGLGLSLVKKLLTGNYRVAATSRNLAELISAAGEKSDYFLPLQCDLTDESSVKKAIEDSTAYFDTIDVVVNNAGYGMTGAIEELTDAEARRNFDVNVFGSLNVLRNVLPVLRRQGSGRIFNIASIGGFYGGFPGFGIYCATKFAVHGFTESLAEEVRPFGIQATVVSPGYFRTSFLESSSLSSPSAPLSEYQSVRDTEKLHSESIRGNQPGDPDKAAEVMIDAASRTIQPVQLFLGADAYGMAEKKISLVQADLELFRATATATAF